MQSYATARNLFGFLGFTAWCLIIAGVLVALSSASVVSEMQQRYGRTDEAAMMQVFVAMAPGAGISLIGLLKIALVQIGRAGVDSAELTQQILKVARDQLEVSRQLLAGHSGVSTSFADAAAKAEEESSASFAEMSNASEERQETLAIEAAHNDPAPTAEDLQPKKMIEYNGAEISQTAAGFLAHDVMFETLDGAKEFVDDRIKVNRRLPGAFKV